MMTKMPSSLHGSNNAPRYDREESDRRTTEAVLVTWLESEGYNLCGEGSDRTLAQPVPVERAKQIVTQIEAMGAEASWAPDHDDRELAWVYC